MFCQEDTMEKQKLIGEKIRKARDDAGLTQEEFGKKIGYSAMGVSYIEKGLRGIKIQDLEEIANVLNTNINYLLQPVTNSDSFYRRGDGEISGEQEIAEDQAMRAFDKLIDSKK